MDLAEVGARFGFLTVWLGLVFGLVVVGNVFLGKYHKFLFHLFDSVIERLQLFFVIFHSFLQKLILLVRISLNKGRMVVELFLVIIALSFGVGSFFLLLLYLATGHGPDMVFGGVSW